jgi:hypothetical protein
MQTFSGSPSLCVISCAIKQTSKSSGCPQSQTSNTGLSDMLEFITQSAEEPILRGKMSEPHHRVIGQHYHNSGDLRRRLCRRVKRDWQALEAKEKTSLEQLW